mmetsp:Transcript_5976/g.15204  ORF Transcript_5976/g.15204 Transcript_5976/m.15204 type:complete len:217 (+) Transcript_5976:782-1432(+)
MAVGGQAKCNQGRSRSRSRSGTQTQIQTEAESKSKSQKHLQVVSEMDSFLFFRHARCTSVALRPLTLRLAFPFLLVCLGQSAAMCAAISQWTWDGNTSMIPFAVCKKPFKPFSSGDAAGGEPKPLFGCKRHSPVRERVMAKHGPRPGWQSFDAFANHKGSSKEGEDKGGGSGSDSERAAAQPRFDECVEVHAQCGHTSDMHDRHSPKNTIRECCDI